MIIFFFCFLKRRTKKERILKRVLNIFDTTNITKQLVLFICDQHI
jgi:hypothetical protein